MEEAGEPQETNGPHLILRRDFEGWADKLRGVWDVGPGDKELTRYQNTFQIFKSWQQPPFGSSLEYIWCIHFFCHSIYVEAPFKVCWLRNEWLQLVRVWQCGRVCGQLVRLRVWGCWNSQVFRLKVWLKWGGRWNVNKYWFPVTKTGVSTSIIASDSQQSFVVLSLFYRVGRTEFWEIKVLACQQHKLGSEIRWKFIASCLWNLFLFHCNNKE